MEKQNLKQVYAIKFCVKLKENITETYKNGLVESMLYRVQGILDGIKNFWMAMRVWKTKLVRESLARQKRDEGVTKVRVLLRYDRRLTVRVIGSELNLNHQTVHDFWAEELGMRKLYGKLVPRLSPTNKRKPDGMCACTFLNASKMTKFFFKYVITQVMNRGFSSTIPKPNDKVRSGARATHRTRRKQE
jgi:hypothetical protein